MNIDDCVNNPCGVGGVCMDAVAAHTCQCMPGYSGTGTARCTNIDDCIGNPCGAGGTCVDGTAEHSCLCSRGYEYVRGTCANIDDCESKPCDPGGTCKDGLDSFTCECANGLLGADGKTCPFIDNRDGTVTDPTQGLLWEREYHIVDRWSEAQMYCQTLRLNSRQWQLPSADELNALGQWREPEICVAISTQDTSLCLNNKDASAGSLDQPTVRCLSRLR